MTSLYESAQWQIERVKRELHDNSLALRASEMDRTDLEDAYVEAMKVSCQAVESLLRLRGMWVEEVPAPRPRVMKHGS